MRNKPNYQFEKRQKDIAKKKKKEEKRERRLNRDKASPEDGAGEAAESDDQTE